MKDLTGIDYYLNGLWTPGTAMLQPALYIQSLADGVSNQQYNVTSLKTHQSLLLKMLEGMMDKKFGRLKPVLDQYQAQKLY